jgi:PDZ domain-containing protein/outer membrane protein with beta-barrel domain
MKTLCARLLCLKDAKMKKIFAFMLLCYVPSSLCVAQDLTRGEVYGGYSYTSASTNGLIPPRQNYNGWETSFSMDLRRWIAAESDVSSYFQNFDLVSTGSTTAVNLNLRGYDFLVGPRVNFRPVFVHALFGIDRLSATAPSLHATQNKFASAAGGGVEWRFSRSLGLRMSADYLFTHHNLFGGSSALQNNVRASAGLVYSFGGNTGPEQKAPAAHQRPEPQPRRATMPQATKPAAPNVQPQPSVVPAVGYMVSLGVRTRTAEIGVKLLEVNRGSAAEFAGLQPGDVIESLDGKPVRTPAELSSALSAHARGDKVKLGFMVKGYWHAETIVTLQ